MTHQDKLQFIREKCIEANPEKWEGVFLSPHAPPDGHSFTERRCGDCFCTIQTVHTHGDEPVFTLADVLLAIGSVVAVDTNGRFIELRRGTQTREIWEASWDGNRGVEIFWNLRADDLSEQSEETISFIYDLLQ